MKTKFNSCFFSFIIFSMVFLSSAASMAETAETGLATGLPEMASLPGIKGETAEAMLAPYVDFLKKISSDPVEYMLSLFDKYQVVVFTEFLHPELTQYEFLMKLISHPDFAKKVRGIFTEVGSITQQPLMDEFLAKKTCDKFLLIRINRENTFHPQGWPNPNILNFWSALWDVNSKLPEDSKIGAWLSDMPWSWDNIKTERDYYLQEIVSSARDKIMASSICAQISKCQSSGSNKKDRFLVILNTRHGLGLVKSKATGSYGENTAAFLKLSLPGKVADILWNSPRAYVEAQNDQMSLFHLIGNGIWEAAFASNGNKPAGFSLKDTPFGKTAFDYHSSFTAENYEQAFDGLVFQTPISNFRSCGFTNGFYDDAAYVEETKRRCKVAGREWLDPALLSQDGNEKPFCYNDDALKFINEQVRQWSAKK
ncbi:MAG: hypothetical protein PHW04_13060 [Candidatus Wallbacteria bacterium]|nr:hypothetical protein [Candidatus Wallbacteria bacterium]